ncbi:phospholipase D/nuclease [Neoconidiobolus thromboides FSU 785]|nr:phospholipase D/nuclease [Neoconidiobolus thromboides FSU 785]
MNEKVLSSDDDSIKEIRCIYRPSYLDGKFSLTYLQYHNDGVKFEDLVNKNHLQKGLFSSYAMDTGWLLSKLPKVCSKIFVIHKPKSRGEVGNLDKQTLIVTPKLYFGVMHAKLMLLYYPTFLRVVIGSANLVDFDWNLIENIVFIQDFPKLNRVDGMKNSEAKAGINNNDSNLDTLFLKDLKEFLVSLHVPKNVYSTLDEYDFSLVKVSLITSCPFPKKTNQGYKHLVDKIHQHFKVDSIIEGDVMYQTSSIGTLTTKFINGFLAQLYPNATNSDLKVIFPSSETVATSLLGTQGGGTIFFNFKKYEECKQSIKKYFYDSISLRVGSLSHCKTIYGTLKLSKQSGSNVVKAERDEASGAKSDDDENEGFKTGSWFYCGSHNFTNAAWGNTTSVKDQGEKLIKTTNYELGVVVCYDSNNKSSLAPIIPYLTPPPAYDTDTEPWIQSSLK